MNKKEQRTIVSVCTHARGGMRAVLESFYAAGVLDSSRDPIIWTHTDGKKFNNIMKFIGAITRLLNFLAFDRQRILIHCHTSMRGSYWRKILVCLLARSFGVPVFMHMHGSEFKVFYQNHGFIGKWIISKTLSCASKVLVLSDSWKNFYSTLVDTQKILVIPNFVKIPEKTSIDRILKFNHNSKHYMLFLGYVGTRKGIYDLIDAVALNLDKLENLKVLIGGNGEVEKAKNYAAAKGVINNFEFLGWVGPEQKIELLKSSDSFILPSHNEGLPVSILEAMSYGLPVIGTNVGAVASLFPKENSFWLVEAQDISTLSERIVSIISDENARKLVGHYNRALIEKFYSEEAVIPILKSAYREHF